MKKPSLALGVPLIFSLLTGCIGGGVVHSKKEELDHFRLGQKGYILPTKNIDNPTESVVAEKWGEPDLKRNERDFTVWRYKTGVRFTGVVPMVGIGVPLLVPTGSDHVDIYMKKGRALKASRFYTGWSGGYYGPEHEGGGKAQFNTLKD